MTVKLPSTVLKLNAEGEPRESVVQLVQEVTKSSSPVQVKSLKGGITNQLLLVSQDDRQLLIRSFGKGTSNFIDREREFAVHKRLQNLGLAPTLYCQFANGLIYGFVPGRPAVAEELNQEYVMKQVSRRLAQWHATLEPKDVANELPKGLTDFWTVLEKWVGLCPPGILSISPEELKSEFAELKRTLAASGGPIVMGHCDLLSANILIPENDSKPLGSEQTDGGLPLVPYGTKEELIDDVASEAAFIDYEYATPCPRAFDIANHFQEWQGYECDKSRVPAPSTNSPQLKFWVQEYLRTYTLLTSSEHDIDQLVSELQAFWGMPGLYWGVWSAIQSQSSDIDFGYREYATQRFQEYLDWKKEWRHPKS